METLRLQNVLQAKLFPEDESGIPENGNGATKNKKLGMGYYFTDRRSGTKSGCCKEKEDCLTTAGKPLLLALQLLGIFPVIFHRSNCTFKHRWFSFPSLYNLVLTIANLVGSIGVFVISAELLAKFQGTDLYTASLVIIAQFGATVLVFATGNFSAPHFCKGWEILHQVADDLKIKKFTILRHYLLFLPSVLILDGIFNTLITRAHAQNQAIKLVISPFTALAGSFIGNFVPNFITFTFAVILWICTFLFDALNQSIESCLQEASPDFLSTMGMYSQDQAERLAKLRKIHEDLCDGVRFLAKAFGFQLLVILPATGLRVIAGIYAVITTMLGLNTETVRSFTAFQGFASIIAGFRIMLIILSSDAVATKATECLSKLKRARCPRNSDELNQEIDVFLNKIGSFPLEITSCGILNLSLSSLSTAIPNVITYILVLMQFKQGDQNSACGNNSTNH